NHGARRRRNSGPPRPVGRHVLVGGQSADTAGHGYDRSAAVESASVHPSDQRSVLALSAVIPPESAGAPSAPEARPTARPPGPGRRPARPLGAAPTRR